MIYQIEKIAYTNVVSKIYKFHYKHMDKYFEEFISGILKENKRIKGPYFYTLNNVPMDEKVEIEMFIPIFDTDFDNTQYKFSTYYEVGPCVKYIINISELNKLEKVYNDMLYYMENMNMIKNTPIFHIRSNDESNYAQILIGYK